MKASIVIIVYNGENTIQRAIDSALSQDFPKEDFEVVVVNDGSKDETLEILKNYQKLIKVINQKNKGAVRAANKGFKAARGKYVIRLDSDDCFKPNILKEMVRVLEKEPRVDFVYCDYYERSKEGKVKTVSTENIFNTLACGVMYKKDRLIEEGFYREDIKLPDYDLLLKIHNKWQGYHIPKPLYHYNRRKESLGGEKKWVREAMDELKKLHPEKIKEIKKIRKL